MMDAFERGDYAFVRSAADKLGNHENEEIRRGAALIVEHTKADPLSYWLLGLAALLLLVLSGWWIVHGKAPEGSGPPASPPVERVR
jgi:hypothetical protein